MYVCLSFGVLCCTKDDETALSYVAAHLRFSVGCSRHIRAEHVAGLGVTAGGDGHDLAANIPRTALDRTGCVQKEDSTVL